MIDSILKNIFVIASPQKEPQRYSQLLEAFQEFGLQNQVTYFQPTWKDTITETEIKTYFSSPTFKNGKPIKRSEMSVWLNHLYLFKHILQNYSEGYFLILESDVRFHQNPIPYFTYLHSFISEVQPDLLSVGTGCGLVHDNVNIEDMNFQIFPETFVRCMDSFLWSYKGIEKFVKQTEHFLKIYGCLDQPVDNFLQTYLEIENKSIPFTQYWLWPSLTLQGSENGFQESLIQKDVT